LATLLLVVVNVVGELKPKRTATASRGFLAAARLSFFKITRICRGEVTSLGAKLGNTKQSILINCYWNVPWSHCISSYCCYSYLAISFVYDISYNSSKVMTLCFTHQFTVYVMFLTDCEQKPTVEMLYFNRQPQLPLFKAQSHQTATFLRPSRTLNLVWSQYGRGLGCDWGIRRSKSDAQSNAIIGAGNLYVNLYVAGGGFNMSP